MDVRKFKAVDSNTEQIVDMNKIVKTKELEQNIYMMRSINYKHRRFKVSKQTYYVCVRILH